MNARAILALAAKDLKLFFADKRALFFLTVTPIVIGAFFGYLFSGNGSEKRVRIPVAIVDEDGSAISRGIFAGLKNDEALQASKSGRETAREAVQKGKITVGVVLPKGFGDASARALFGGAAKPELELYYDPSHWGEMGMVRGLLTQHVMEAVSREAFSGSAGRKALEDSMAAVGNSTSLGGEDKKSLSEMLQGIARWQDRQEAAKATGEKLPAGGMSVPFTTKEEAVTSGSGVRYNGYSHSFAGMGLQFILFAAIDFGVAILLEKKQGLWKRFRSAPISRFTLLAGRAVSSATIALYCLAATFGVGMLVFGIRVHGSVVGFVGLCAASALMASTFGLMLAALGRTPNATRGIAILAVLLLVMLGGGWVPSFIFPAWMQTATLVIPTRWAVDGFDGVTWRGIGLLESLPAIGVLLGFTLLFGGVTLWRFRWEED